MMSWIRRERVNRKVVVRRMRCVRLKVVKRGDAAMVLAFNRVSGCESLQGPARRAIRLFSPFLLDI